MAERRKRTAIGVEPSTAPKPPGHLPAEPANGASEIIPRAARFWLLGLLPLAFALLYFSNPKPAAYFDYTYRIAGEFLHGRLGTVEAPPSWLNEMVRVGQRHYTVFPLGAVLSMVPLALLGRIGLIQGFPGMIVVATLASVTTLVFFCLSARFADSVPRRLLFSLWPILGTWAWCNLSYAGAWQIALGVAMVAEAAALYFTLVSRRPFWAGVCFAVAFGNRTEILLTAPLFLYLLMRSQAGPSTRPEAPRSSRQGAPDKRSTPSPTLAARVSDAVSALLHALKKGWGDAVWFVLVPCALGECTLIYNYARFSSITDFGYARIPGVLAEPWYRYGIFSLHAIPGNAEKMIWELWGRVNNFPYFVPSAWGGSIFLSSPLLLLLFRWRARDRGLQSACWIAIVVLTFVLWCHGNTGGLQYSYRYAMVLVPWMFILLQANGRPRLGAIEAVLLFLSFAMNAWATYLYHRTPYLRW